MGVTTENLAEKYNISPKEQDELAVLSYSCAIAAQQEQTLSIMGIGPVYAVLKALKQAELKLEDIDYFEINEAFAAQFLACNRELKLPMDKVNVNGSGIGLGHPVGCTGARIIVSLISEMQRRGVKYGVTSLCVGGAPAIATVIELLQ